MEVMPEIHDTPDAIELTHVLGNVEFRDVTLNIQEDYDHVLKTFRCRLKRASMLPW